MKKMLLMAVLISSTIMVNAQEKYFTRSGKVSFFSKTDMENIEAINTKGTSVMDLKSGQIEFAVLMKAFEFEKELMMEHFNENYVESDKFPKSTFKGTIKDFESLDLSKDGSYPVKIKGQLTLHGVTKDVATDGLIEVKSGKMTGKSNFIVALEDYNITVPGVVKDNIAKTIKIEIVAAYERMPL